MRTFYRALLVISACMSCTAHADSLALIMAIGEYALPEAAPLAGVPQDVVSAKEIARKFGVSDANMTVLRDSQLTLEGMAKAFNDLERRVAQNDNVFIYYTGHGGRQRVSDPVERCAESLYTYDGYGFIDSEVEQRLKLISGKANRIVMFIDACHSGGVTTRGARQSPFKAKYVAKDGPDACERPVNVLTRGLAARSQSSGSGAQNYVYIAAARDNEVSLDEAGKGGLATQAWHECLAGEARDLDGSGAITADEVRVCAQKLIDERLKNIEGFSSHHISITGNSRAVMDFDAAGPDASAATPAETLKDILGQRDDRRTVTVSLSQPRLKIGRDALDFTVTSSHAGYLYLLMAGSDGKAFDVLFPNKLDARNEVEAGAALRLPRGEWQITAAGPAGTSHLLAMVTDSPRDFSKLGMQATGPFSMLEASGAAAKNLQRATMRGPGASDADCSSATKERNLQVAKRCSNAFGAALVTVEEVQ